MYISDDVPITIYIGVGIAGYLLMLTAILTLVIGMVVWCTKKYKTSRNDADYYSYPEQPHAHAQQDDQLEEKFTGLPIELQLKGNEAYCCTNDLIPTQENVAYGRATPNISTRENIAYGHVTHVSH